MKYIKTYENSDEIQYSIGDIVTFTTKIDEYNNYIGYINQNDVFNIEKGNPVYGRKYKVIDIYKYGYRYNNVKKSNLYNMSVDIEDIESGRKIKNVESNFLTLSSKWIKPDEPMIGDYVIIDVSNKYDSDRLNNFLENNIGRYVDYNFNNDKYTIRYRNVKSVIGNYFWNTTNPYISDLGNINVERINIKKYSPNKEELEEYIEISKKVNKYNL